MSPEPQDRAVIDLRDDLAELRALTASAAALARGLGTDVRDDGELSVRLVDASYALHRALVALSDEPVGA